MKKANWHETKKQSLSIDFPVGTKVSFWTEDTARTTGFIDSEPLLVTQNRFYFRIKHYVGLLAEAKYIKKVQWDT